VPINTRRLVADFRRRLCQPICASHSPASAWVRPSSEMIHRGVTVRNYHAIRNYHDDAGGAGRAPLIEGHG
jgi:hypothetical protein